MLCWNKALWTNQVLRSWRLNKFYFSIAKIPWNKALWLDVPSHVTSLNQLECLISVQHSYNTRKLVNDNSSRIRPQIVEVDGEYVDHWWNTTVRCNRYRLKNVVGHERCLNVSLFMKTVPCFRANCNIGFHGLWHPKNCKFSKKYFGSR